MPCIFITSKVLPLGNTRAPSTNCRISLVFFLQFFFEIDYAHKRFLAKGKLSDTKCWRLSWPRKDVLNLRASVVNFQHEFFHIETQLIENGFFVVPRATSVSLSSFPTLKSEASLYVFSLSNCDIDRNICGTASVSKGELTESSFNTHVSVYLFLIMFALIVFFLFLFFNFIVRFTLILAFEALSD